MIKKIFFILTLTLISVAAIVAQGNGSSTAAATAKSNEPSKKPASFRSTKDQVTEAQALLKAKKLYNGEATGTSSADWKTAVKTYQGDNGLAKTGSLNRATLEKMEINLTDKQKEIPADPKHFVSADVTPAKSAKLTAATTGKAESTAPAGPKRPAPFQASVDQIIALQTKLKETKLFAGEADGKRSDNLKGAVKKYQETNSLKATGGINAETLTKMGITLTDKQKQQVAAQAAYDAAKASKN